MWSILPAAGRGKRLSALTKGLPKPLMEVRGMPLIAGVIDQLGDGISDVCIVVPPHDFRIPRALGDERSGRRLHYVVQEEPLGVGHAVLQGAGLVTGSAALVVMADAYFSDSLGAFVDAWSDSGADGAVLLERPDMASSALMGRVHASGDRVVELSKCPPTPRFEWRVAGAFVLPAASFGVLANAEAQDTGEIEVEGAITRLLGTGQTFAAIPYDGWRVNVNRPEDVDLVSERIGGAVRGSVPG